MKALITGAPGQLAHYCADFLVNKDYEVVLTYNSTPDDSLDVAQKQLDITNAESVVNLIADFKPDEIYNFAGISSPAVCDSLPLDAINTNIMGACNIFEACRLLENVNPRILHASSEYAEGPISLYGLTKAISSDIGMFYREKYGLNIYSALLPHCESPLRGNSFFLGKLLKWLRGLSSIIKEVGVSESDFEFSNNEILVIYHNEIVFRYPKIRLGNMYNKLSWMTASDAISMIHHYLDNVDVSAMFTIDRGLYYTPADIMEKIMLGAGFKQSWGKYYVFDSSISNRSKPVEAKFTVDSLDVEGNIDSFISFLLQGFPKL